MVWLLNRSGNEAGRAQQVFDLFMMLSSHINLKAMINSLGNLAV